VVYAAEGYETASRHACRIAVFPSAPRSMLSGSAMTEDELIALLGKIQALHARPGTDGERRAALAARDRIQKRLDDLRETTARAEPEIEHRFSVHDPWSRKLLLALLRRHGLRPYRYPRQRRTTIMVRATRRFVEEELWPEFEALLERLHAYLAEATDRIIAAAVHPDGSDPAEFAGTPPAG